jgi:uncharacterized membrane protein
VTGFRPRRRYIDWARALAVLVMIEAHTLDAWTRAADRRTVAFRDATILGGFAAPLFLWLAGVSLVLSAASVASRTGSRRAAAATICRRGLEIFVLAFLFRVQAFLLSPGSQPVALFRVDILNIMGPAVVAAGVVWGLVSSMSPRRWTSALVAAYAAIAAALAMLTPIVRASALVGRLPVWFQWYIRPTDDMTTFTTFPWAGFVFAGAAAGALIAASRDPAGECGPVTGSERSAHAEARVQIWLAAAGAALVAVGFYTATLPSIYVRSSFWTSSPTWFAIRTGILMLALASISGLAEMCERAGIALRPLERFGRRSLFVYWIHVELVYGYLAWSLHHRLPLWGTFIAYGFFCVSMYGAVVLRDAIVESWSSRRGVAAVPWFRSVRVPFRT